MERFHGIAVCGMADDVLKAFGKSWRWNPFPKRQDPETGMIENGVGLPRNCGNSDEGKAAA